MEESINEKLLEKLKIYSSTVTHDKELLRTVASKLLSRASSQDKQIREKTLFQIKKKKDNVLQTLLGLIEVIDDQIAVASIAGVLRECISPRAVSRLSVIRQLIDLNASHNLIKLLVQQQQSGRELPASDMFLHELIWILGQLSQKDVKFPGRLRQLNALPIINLYLKIFHQLNSKLVLPLLMIVKCVAKNGNLSSALIKDNVSVTLEKIFLTTSLAPSSKLKLILNIFSYLSKNTQFCNRLIKVNFVPIFLKIFANWEKYTGKTRIKICTDTIIILQYVCLTKQGRSIVRRENGFSPFYKFCVCCPEDKVYDRLLSKVCAIINLCLEKKELPLGSTLNPVHFELPVELKKDHDNEYIADSDDTDEDVDDINDGNDSDSNRKINDRSDEKALPEIPDLLDNKRQKLPEVTSYRSISDLQMYRKMFEEFYFFFYNGKHDLETLSPSSRYQKIDKNFDQYNGNTLDERNCFTSAEGTGAVENVKNNDFQILEDLDDTIMTQRAIYSEIANRVKNVMPFSKIAYPDMMGGDGIGILQPFYTRDRKICRTDQTLFASFDALNAYNFQTRFLKRSLHKRSKLVDGVDRCIPDDRIYNNVVYDLDKLLLLSAQNKRLTKRLSNNDETRIGIKETTSSLNFESRFESGNLRKAIQVGPREYDLILSPDVNSSNHCQWFYFEVSNMDNMAAYTFNVINCEKSSSQFNYGMKPIMYSVCEATLRRAGWFRAGTDICYYRNGYKIPHNNKRTFLTASFSIKFPHNLDICYIAYTFPYTYSQLMYRIRNWIYIGEKNGIYVRTDNLCDTLNDNAVPLLTISAPDTKANRIADREIVFLTSRVHPGEAIASWIIDGSITHLLSTSCNAVKLRDQYIFKIVPMLNVEGVINGCHRCCLTDEDLNRKWSCPDAQLHPTIYHTKGLLNYSARVLRRTPFIFCDFHGHSRRKNVFFFGCSNQESWLESDRNLPNVGIEHLLLPHFMENCSPAFSSELCSYRVERNRESTARVTVWREFGVRKSYTMETSYCGCDQGPYKGFHFDTNHLQEIGTSFCTALTSLYEEKKCRIEMIVKQDGNRYIYSSSSHINNNYVHKFVSSSTVANIQGKLIPLASPVSNTWMSPTNLKKIPSPVAVHARVTSSQMYSYNFKRKEI